MSDSILDKYAARRPEEGDDSRLAPLETVDDLGSFGWLRGIRDRAVMLELRKKDGNILAVGYGWLERADFNPSDGITLHVVGRSIRIRGRNLNAEVRSMVKLYEGLTRHRVPWVQEAGECEGMKADEKSPLIEKIEW